jgi:hypothetical protein
VWRAVGSTPTLISVYRVPPELGPHSEEIGEPLYEQDAAVAHFSPMSPESWFAMGLKQESFLPPNACSKEHLFPSDHQQDVVK